MCIRDSLTTDKEVRNVIKRDSDDLAGDMRVTLTKANTREQNMAIVKLGERGAANFLKTGRIKIGWVYGRVRRRALVMRCYACFGFGHRQADCKGPDRRKAVICIQCSCCLLYTSRCV